MNKKILSLVSNSNNLIKLDDDFIVLDNPNVKILEGLAIKSESSIILHCICGSIKLAIDMVELTLEKNSVVYLTQGQLYEILCVSNTFKSNVLVLSENFLKWIDLKSIIFFRNQSDRVIQSTSHGSFEKYIGICKDIILKDPNPEKKEVIQLLSKAYVIGLSHFGTMNGKDLSVSDTSTKLVHHFLQILNSNNQFHRSLEYYSDILNVTAKHLSFACRKSTGRNASFWINHATVLEAKRLLCGTDCPIALIAEQLDFSSQSVFGRFFKRETGCSPLAYRQNNRLL